MKEGYKLCKKCGAEKEDKPENFRPKNHVCRLCMAEHQRQLYYLERGEIVKPKDATIRAINAAKWDWHIPPTQAVKIAQLKAKHAILFAPKEPMFNKKLRYYEPK